MIEKVTAFILRAAQPEPQILVFEHPTAGLQLPAGTVEEGEDPQTAVLREAAEETGLKKLEVIRKLDAEHQFTTQEEAVLVQSMRLFVWPARGASRSGPLFNRGHRFLTFERKVGFTKVKYEDYDLNKKTAKILHTYEGWLPSEFLTHELQRHFYLLRVLEDTPDSWSQLSDQGHTFRLKWAPLLPHPNLIGEQAAWLDHLDGVTFDG
jgi:8-oxo-dGTP pyrophosphatase MutT (NUDIX family)